jgi:hypothetical protein
LHSAAECLAALNLCAAIVENVRKLRAGLLEGGGRTGRRKDKKMEDRKMGFLFIFLSSMFLSACPVPLRLCTFAALR